MLTANFLDLFYVPLLEIYYQFESAVIADIARRIGKASFDSASWQVQRLSESGMLYDDILKKLETLTGKSEAELRKIFKQAGVKTMTFDDNLYRLAGFQPTPLNLSPAMSDVLTQGLIKTMGVLRNLTMTTATVGQQAFLDALDVAYFEVSTGSMSYTQAINEAVTAIADNGLSVIGFKGRKDQLDVAVRRAVLTGVNQTAGELQITRANEMNQDLVQTSAHIGARNKGTGPENHESWQGRVFSRGGMSHKYPSFIDATGYGTITGLCGINCRHSFFPFFEGLSQNAYDEATLDSYEKKTVTYQGKEISVYEATQIQRSIERQIRFWKRRESALDAASQIYSPEGVQALNKVDYYQGVMRSFIRETGLDRQRVRESL